MSQDAVSTLRIGICACTKAYHGKLAGRVLAVNQVTEYRYFDRRFFESCEPRMYRVEEVLIREKRHHEPLKTARCHFFLDVHEHKKYHVPITREDVDAPPSITYEARLYAMYIVERGGVQEYHAGGTPLWGDYGRVYKRKKIPFPSEILKGMASILRDMDQKGLERWLEVMG